MEGLKKLVTGVHNVLARVIMIDDRRAKNIIRLRDRIAGADLTDDEIFRTLLIDAQELLELSDRELGDAFQVSRPTVNRWIKGRNLPHNALRRPLFRWVQEALAERSRRLQMFAQRSGSAA